MIIVLLLLVLITGYISCAEAIFERDWPRSTIKGFIIALLLLFAGIQAFGQASRYDNIVSTINQSAPQPGGQYPALFIPNSGINVCSAPANAVPCTNFATTYTNAAAGTACQVSPTPLQLTRPDSSTCVANADSTGGWGVWMLPGNYQYTITTTYGSFGPYDFTVGSTSGGGGSGTNNQVVDAVAQCGLVGDGATDNSSTLSTCYAAHPHTTIFFPPLYPTTLTTQATYVLNSGTVVPSTNSIESAGWAYNPTNVQGAILKCPATVNCVQLSQNAAIQNINVIGSEPSSTSTIDPQNIIFPSGSTLAEYQQPILEIGVTSGVMTLAFYPALPALWRVGGAVQVNLPSPYAALSGTYYVQTVIGGYGTVGSSTYPYTQITVNVPGAGNQTLTMINGTCPTGCVMPATTGASNSVGIRIAGTFTTVHNVYVANFARAGIETDGQDFTADDPDIENAIVYGNRGYGYFSVGGDSNVANLRHIKSYFNGIYGFMDVSFLHNYYESPQTTCNGNCQETVGGPQVNISSISRSCSGFTCTISATTSANHGFSVGNGVFIQGVSDTTFNTPTAISNTVGCFIATVPALNQFTCSQPTYTVALSNATSSGGSVALGSAFQVYTGSAMDTGSYAFGHNTTFANHFVIMNPYAEGGQGEYDPFHCSIVANSGTMILQAEFGDCINQTALPSITQAYGALGWQFTPFTVVQGGGQGTQSAAFSPETQLLTGFGSDASSMLGFNDFLCANLNPVGGFPGCGVDNRFTDPGQNDSWYGMRVTVSADQPGQYNYPALFGYGATKQSGETTAIGSAAFTGTGLNDATSGGSATSTNEQTYVASICATGTPDSWTYSTSSMGPIATLTLGSSAGSGYQVGEWVTVNSTGAPGTLSAIIQVDSLGGGGAISTFHIIPGQNGVNFTIRLNNTTTPLYGFMASYTVGTAGTGYAVGDTGFVASGNNSIQNTYVVNSVNGSGGVTGITITNVTGAQYGIFTNKPTIRGGAQPGTGTGLAINITGIAGSGATVNILALTNGSACATMAAGGSPNSLANGVTITWAASTGHTLADKWSIPLTVTLGQRPPAWFPNGYRMGNSTWNAGPRKFVECEYTTTPSASCSPDGNFGVGDVAWNDGFLSTATPASYCSAAHTSGSTSICDTWVGLGSGGGGGGVGGGGTSTFIPIWTAGTTLGNSPLSVANNTLTDTDTNGISTPQLFVGTSGALAQAITTYFSNATSTGTVALFLAKIVGTTAVTPTTSDTAVRVFPAIASFSVNGANVCAAGTTGQACLVMSGQATLTFDAGGGTANHYCGVSTSVAGTCTDLASISNVTCVGLITANVASNATGTVALGVCPANSSSAGGTVTSVAVTVPTWLTVSGSPITSSGTFAITATTGETANEVLATPNGSTGAVGLRALVAADLPGQPFSISPVALPTSSIGANACTLATGSPFTATGVTTSMVVIPGFASDPTSVTGYGTSGGLSVNAWPTSNAVNVTVCNSSASPITPGAMTVNIRVIQ